MNGISVLRRETPQGSPPPLLQVRTQREDAAHEPERGPSPDTDSLDLGFPASRTVRTQAPQSVASVTAAQMDSDSPPRLSVSVPIPSIIPGLSRADSPPCFLPYLTSSPAGFSFSIFQKPATSHHHPCNQGAVGRVLGNHGVTP